MLSRRVLSNWALGCFTYFGLVYYSQGVIAALQAARGDVARTVSGETNLSSTLAQSVILAGLLIAVARAPGWYLRLCRHILPILCIAGLALLSVLWSADPVRTLRRAVALNECMLFGMFLYRTDGLERTIGRLGRVCVAMAVLSLLAYVVAPSIGRETALGYERAMRGVFPQKNSMSECMLLGLCCYAYRLIDAPRWRHAGAVALLTLCLVLGRGASVLAVAGVVFLVATWMWLCGKPVLRMGLLFLVGWSAVVLTVALIAFPQDVFALAGRDASLTGRVPLWQAIWPEIMLSPLIGHGYAGFWNADSPTVQMIWRYAGWEAPDAHSSYLDIMLQLGVVGLVLYAWSWATMVARARAAQRTGLGASRFVLLFGIALPLIGLDEGAILIPNAWTMLRRASGLGKSPIRSLPNRWAPFHSVLLLLLRPENSHNATSMTSPARGRRASCKVVPVCCSAASRGERLGLSQCCRAPFVRPDLSSVCSADLRPRADRRPLDMRTTSCQVSSSTDSDATSLISTTPCPSVGSAGMLTGKSLFARPVAPFDGGVFFRSRVLESRRWRIRGDAIRLFRAARLLS